MDYRPLRRRLTTSSAIGALFLVSAGVAAAQTEPAPPVPTMPAQPPAAPGSAVVAQTEPAPPVQAPPGQPPAAPGSTVQEVVVTGSRIPRPNLTSVSPVTSVSSQEIKFQGATDVVDVLDNLPQTSIGLNNTPNPLSSGIGYTTVNLRGLGAPRTLVLIDGRRMAPGDPTLGGDVPDLDTIPTQLVDRVEVVSGGASAVYGSDAIAGVVNFIMKRNFQGLQIDVQAGMNEHNNDNTTAQNLIVNDLNQTPPNGYVTDGGNQQITITAGANSPDSKGNVTAYMSYRNQEPVPMSSRDFADCELLESNNAFTCSGSSNSNRFIDLTNGSEFQVSGGPGSNTFLPWPSGGQTTNPPAIFNSSPFEYLSRQDLRYQGGFLAHYDMSSFARFYAEFSYTSDKSTENIAPGGVFLGDTFTVNCDNPFLSAAQVAQMSCTNPGPTAAGSDQFEIGRRDIEGGPRQQFYDHSSFRDVIGVKGQIDDAWSYDLYGSYSETDYTQTTLGYFSTRNLQNALNVVDVDGVPTCLSVVNGTDPNCVPYNIFVNSTGRVVTNPMDGVTQAALNYLEVPSILTGDTTQEVVNLDFVGLLGNYGIQLPWAHDGVGVSVGAEYRRDSLELTPDAENLSGDLQGGPGVIPKVAGAYHDDEVFTELRVPIAQDLDWVRDLTFELGYRRADYSTAGPADSYKYGVDWAIDHSFRVRASFERAVRAPNVNELFYPVAITNQSTLGVDPCAGPVTNGTTAFGATLAQCERTGVTPAQFGSIIQCPAEQCGGAEGGNTALRPEKSDTISFGMVFTPAFFHGFTFSADYFDIDVNGAIGTVPFNVSFDQCLDTGEPTFCSLVHRSPLGALFGNNTIATGGYIAGVNENIGFLKTTGADFEMTYHLRFDDVGLQNTGTMDFNFIGTWVDSFISEPVPGLGSYDCAGYFGATCGVEPAWRSKFRITWNSPWKYSISMQWRMIGGMTQDVYSSNPLLAGPPDPLQRTIPTFNYLDLSAIWTVHDHIHMRAGINNVFDKDPPWVTANLAGTGSPNSFPLYDLLGRVMFLGVTADW